MARTTPSTIVKSKTTFGLAADQPRQSGPSVDQGRTGCPRPTGEHRGDAVSAAHRRGRTGLHRGVVRAGHRVRVEQRDQRGEVAAS